MLPFFRLSGPLFPVTASLWPVVQSGVFLSSGKRFRDDPTKSVADQVMCFLLAQPSSYTSPPNQTRRLLPPHEQILQPHPPPPKNTNPPSLPDPTLIYSHFKLYQMDLSYSLMI